MVTRLEKKMVLIRLLVYTVRCVLLLRGNTKVSLQGIWNTWRKERWIACSKTVIILLPQFPTDSHLHKLPSCHWSSPQSLLGKLLGQLSRTKGTSEHSSINFNISKN